MEAIKEMSCQNGAVVFRQVLSKLLYFSDRGHSAIIVGSHVEASEQREKSRIRFYF